MLHYNVHGVFLLYIVLLYTRTMYIPAHVTSPIACAEAALGLFVIRANSESERERDLEIYMVQCRCSDH